MPVELVYMIIYDECNRISYEETCVNAKIFLRLSRFYNRELSRSRRNIYKRHRFILMHRTHSNDR